jgi:hypothetical protein
MEDLDKMQECGLIPYWNITEGTLDDEIFASFSGSEGGPGLGSVSGAFPQHWIVLSLGRGLLT